MSDEHLTTPKLSANGAKLLRTVVSKQNGDRHNSLTARRSARRRAADALRAPVEGDDVNERNAEIIGAGKNGTVINGVNDVEHIIDADAPRFIQETRARAMARAAGLTVSDVEPLDPPEDQRRWMGLIVVGVILGVCVVLAMSLESRPAGQQIEAAPTRDAAPVVANGFVVDISEVSLLSDSVRSFVVEVRNDRAPRVDTASIGVVLENEGGEPVQTFVRFDRRELVRGETAVATTRAEGVDLTHIYVTVTIDGVAIERRTLWGDLPG